jgi:two-component system chemotaxis sensor kinase CheA
MNEFIEQFLIEARELVEKATNDLLALEQDPTDAARLEDAFRAFHTLKGAAGIVEFPAMGRALHAAEEMLARLRSEAQGLTPALIGDCLSCLDQVVRWLDAMQASGQVPGDAEAAADLVAARFAGAPAEAQPETWLDALLEKAGAASADARVAIRYTPDPECFFRGEDPLQRMGGLPGLLTLDLGISGPTVSLEALAPFDCRLILRALSDASLEEVTAFFLAAKGEVEVRPVSRPGSDLPVMAEALIAAQIQLLAETGRDGFDGRLGSAGRVAANVLRHAGFDAAATVVEKALAASRSAGEPGSLSQALQQLLSKEDAAEMAIAASPVQVEVARSLRVNVERIDALVKLTGELTVAKNAIGHLSGQAQQGFDPKDLAGQLKSQHALLERLVTELQHTVLGLRVLPLRHVFQRFPRVVREIAASLGKSARLVIAGEETDADKVIVENLFEPLVHVLRNAIDHGLEAPEIRIGLGKPIAALIRLSASRQREHVVIEVADDGSGIDIERVRQVALQRGLASAEALQAMSQSEIADLTFAPGFSTARHVTGLSGRGIGMDAVRTAVEGMGGRVALDNNPGKGVTIRFILPYTILMTDVVTVEAGGQVFGIPLDTVIETVRILRTEIMPVGAARAFVLRNRTIPLIDLGQMLGHDLIEPREAGANVVVTSFAGQFGGIEVDRLGEKMQVMLKPIDGLLAGTPGLAGTTLLGDGRVLLVLDVPELLR